MHRRGAACPARALHNRTLRITAHVGVPGRDPDAHPAANRDHRSARSAAVTISGEACGLIFTRDPLASSIRIAAGSGSGAFTGMGSPAKIAGAKADPN